MPKEVSAVGRRIKALREAVSLTQQELAVRAGLSVSNLSQIEQGQKTDPRVSTVQAIARALGVSVTKILEDDPEAKKPQAPPATPPAGDLEAVAKKPAGRRKK